VVFIFRGLKDLLTPVLAGILESEPSSAMSFEEFFARIQDILSRKVLQQLKRMISTELLLCNGKNKVTRKIT